MNHSLSMLIGTERISSFGFLSSAHNINTFYLFPAVNFSQYYILNESFLCGYVSRKSFSKIFYVTFLILFKSRDINYCRNLLCNGIHHVFNNTHTDTHTWIEPQGNFLGTRILNLREGINNSWNREGKINFWVKIRILCWWVKREIQ